MFKVAKFLIEFGVFLFILCVFLKWSATPKVEQPVAQEVIQPPVVDFSKSWMSYSRNTGDYPSWNRSTLPRH